MTTSADRTKFLSIKTRYQIAANDYDALDSALRMKYGSSYQKSWLKSSDVKKLDALTAKKGKLSAQMHDLLARIAPRDWGSGVSSWWVMNKLTWEDAITTGPLSTMPDPSYGNSEREMRAFMQPVRR